MLRDAAIAALRNGAIGANTTIFAGFYQWRAPPAPDPEPADMSDP
jgi:hypothetical protein